MYSATKHTAASDLGKALKDARTKRGLTQAQCAERLGLNSAQSVSDWEGNRGSSIPIPMLKRLIDILEIPEEVIYEIFIRFHQDRVRTKMEKQLWTEAPPSRKKSAGKKP